MEWSLGGPLSELYPRTPPANEDCRINRLSFNIHYGKNVLKSSSLKLLSKLGPNCDGMVPTRWSPFRVVSADPAHQPTLVDIGQHSFNIGP